MRTFYLRLKKGKEAISKVSAQNLEEALIIFCEKKKLKAKQLLEIYLITE